MKKTILLLAILSFALCGFPQGIKRFRVVWSATSSPIHISAPIKVTAGDGNSLEANRLKFLKFGDNPCIGETHFGLDAVCIFPMAKSIGLDIMCNYHRFGVEMNHPNNDTRSRFITNSVVPEINLRIIFGDQLQNSITPVLYLGAAYNYHFSFKGDLGVVNTDVNAVNNGFEGVAGFGIQSWDLLTSAFGIIRDFAKNNADYDMSGFPTNSYFSAALMYRYGFYDYFNQGYDCGSGNRPFDGISSRFGEVYFRFVIGFN